LQLQKLFQITPSSSTNFMGFFSPLSYFPGVKSILAVNFELENQLPVAHLSAYSLPLGPACRRMLGTSMPHAGRL
jgi:hypothetical protein